MFEAAELGRSLSKEEFHAARSELRVRLLRAQSAVSHGRAPAIAFFCYWTWQPPRGRIAMFLGSWYANPIPKRAYGDSSDAQFDLELARIVDCERTLTDGGTLLIKLWLHLPETEQKHHFEKLEKSRLTRWRVSKRDWRNHRHYAEFAEQCGKCVRETSTARAPWTVIEATDSRRRSII